MTEPAAKCGAGANCTKFSGGTEPLYRSLGRKLRPFQEIAQHRDDRLRLDDVRRISMRRSCRRKSSQGIGFPETFSYHLSEGRELLMATSTFRTAASQGFERLVELYKRHDIFEGNFWFGGNSLDTCIDYLLAAGLRDQGRIVEFGYKQVYQPLRTASDWWHDDYGWWGIALLKAYVNRERLGYDNPGLFEAILDDVKFCWGKLNENWDDDSDYAPGVPNGSVKGGVWNTKADNQAGPPFGLKGRNSVTNEGFWILSQGLVRACPTEVKYKQAVEKEAAWFEKWLSVKGGILNPQGLVLERPLGLTGDWHWSGDQGLFVGALLGPDPKTLPPHAEEIAKAVLTHMTDPAGVLHEDMRFDAEYHQFIDDYATGKGVCVRYLSQLLPLTRDSDLAGFIKVNAKAVWCNRPDNKTTDLVSHQFGFNWNPGNGQEPLKLEDGKPRELEDLIMQAAGQDALNAALRLAPDEAITRP